MSSKGVTPFRIHFVHQAAIRFAALPIGFALIAAISVAADRAGVTASFCLLRSLTGMRCLGCGVTTSVMALLHGSVSAALSANVAGPAVVAVFVTQVACVAFAALELFPLQTVLRWSRWNDRVLLCSLILGWLFHLFTH